MEAEMMPIDVLIVTRDAGDLLAACLAGLRSQTHRPARIVVVSSGQKLSPITGVEILHTDSPTDFAPAANLGLAAMGDRPVVLLNDDTIPAPDFLAELAKAIDGEGIYQPSILLPDGRVDNNGHWLFWDGFNVAHSRGQQETEHRSICGAFSGAAVLFTPGVLNVVGHFDSDFEAFGEDLDLSLRAIRHGFTIRHAPHAKITHRLGATYGRISPRKIFLIERNRTSAAVRSLPFTAVAAMPVTTGLRLGLMAANALKGAGLGHSVGWKGAAAAIAGLIAGTTRVPSAWLKRRHDKPNWTASDADMWDHIKKTRAPWDKLSGTSLIAH
jgi:GT2 family glycosyltransferase